MTERTFGGLVLAVLLGCVISAQVPATAYDVFAKLPKEQRQGFWGKATAHEKSEIAQGHARAWLKQNESRLSSHQIAVVTDAIGMLTADFYSEPGSESVKAKAAQLRQRLSCAIWMSDMIAVLRPTRDPFPVSWLEDMSAWFNGCFLGR